MQVYAVFANYYGNGSDQLLALWAEENDAKKNLSDLRNIIEHTKDYYFILPVVVN